MKTYPGGVWPVMLTPYTEKGELDKEGLAALTNWYIENGVSGLFSACQSSEIGMLSLEERVAHARVTVEAAKGRVPVVASGHISDGMDEQVRELSAMAETGVDAVILISNHLATPHEDDYVWMRNCETLLSRLDPHLDLGVYECPHPYKRLMSQTTLKFLADTGRFYFMKDTCCDAAVIEKRLEVLKGTGLKLYNANAATLLPTLRMGAAGFSGVMANFYPKLFSWMCAHPDHPNAQKVQDMVTVCALMECQVYPCNAKFRLGAVEGLPVRPESRVCDDKRLNGNAKEEIFALDRVMADAYERLCR